MPKPIKLTRFSNDVGIVPDISLPPKYNLVRLVDKLAIELGKTPWNWFLIKSMETSLLQFVGENEIFDVGQLRLIISRLLLWVRESSGKWAKHRPQCPFFKSCQSEGNWLTTPTAPPLSLFCWNLIYYFHIFNLHFLIFYFPATFQIIS